MFRSKNLNTKKVLVQRTSASEWYYFCFIAFFLAILVPFEPYDWVQRAVTAVVNSKDYRGDAVIVAIDEKTESRLASKVWSQDNLADLIQKVGSASAKQIIIDRQFFAVDTQDEGPALARALGDLKRPAAWIVDLSPSEAAAIASSDLPAEKAGMAKILSRVPTPIVGRVNPAIMTFRSYAFGAPTYAANALQTREGLVPSAAVILSGKDPGDVGPVVDVDLSIVPDTIPTYSAADVLEGTVGKSELADKSVVISFTRRLGRDFAVTPNDTYTSRAALTIMAAETIAEGPGVSLGWLPAFILALISGILWMVLPRPFGRIAAIGTFSIILLSPLVLEPMLVFQATSQGVSLLLLLAAGKLWQRVRSLVQEYRTASEAKSQFLAQASHDLRQPIHAIGLLTDRLQDTDLSEEQSELLSKISWSVDNASRMFRALLDIAAIESGALRAEIVPVSIADLFAELDSQNALSAEMQNVDLRLVPCSAVVRSDRALLATMLQNLVSNAIRYSPGRKVLVGCRRRGNSVTILVMDNGRGIPPRDLEHVNKAFFRSAIRSDLRSENKGLGLSIVSRLADMLDLRFSLSSEQGRGTAASIENLRLVVGHTEAPAALSGLKLPLAGVRVFVVEDDRETLASTQRLLEGWGCIVETSAALPVAMPQADILLSDFDLADGETLADRPDLLRNARKQCAKLIVISGHHPDTIHERLPDLDALVLLKPLRAAELRSALMAVRSA